MKAEATLRDAVAQLQKAGYVVTVLPTWLYTKQEGHSVTVRPRWRRVKRRRI